MESRLPAEGFHLPHPLFPALLGAARHDGQRTGLRQTFTERASQHSGAADDHGYLAVKAEQVV